MTHFRPFESDGSESTRVTFRLFSSVANGLSFAQRQVVVNSEPRRLAWELHELRVAFRVVDDTQTGIAQIVQHQQRLGPRHFDWRLRLHIFFKTSSQALETQTTKHPTGSCDGFHSLMNRREIPLCPSCITNSRVFFAFGSGFIAQSD